MSENNEKKTTENKPLENKPIENKPIENKPIENKPLGKNFILAEKYQPKIVEKKWQEYWHHHKIYQFRDDLSKDQTFVIDTPPPTVSGLLHMGHVFSYTQADFVARYNRMSGKDVFYPMGFDDNGLPTERLVEKIIGKKAGIYENENGHGSFVSKCREVVDEAEKEFKILFNEIALSVDWKQKYQTISPEVQKISQASFIDLFNKKLVEKQNQPVFWDISDLTALAQADIIDKEVEGEMYFFDFAIQGNANNLEIMTTRPELLPACVAVMINGQDERYQNLILDKDKFANQGHEGQTGSFAISPLFGVIVPIIADNSVQIDKGTGVVMCCTFGDETDVEWWEKYDLPLRAIIGESGILRGGGDVISKPCDIFEGNINEANCLNLKNFVEVFERIVLGNRIKKTRELIINELSEISAKYRSQKIIRPVKCAERSGVPIEFLIRPQWYIKIRDKKDKLKQKSRECNWYPEYMRVRIEQWIEGLSRDWCISRQRFFGVKFPVWYSKRKGEEGKIIIASLDQLPCDPFVDLPEGYLKEEVYPETDIMDTWATSSISPQLSSKGISDEVYFDEKSQVRHQKLFPADIRPQAHEIIRTWAFYTITKAYLHSLNRIKNDDGSFAENADGSLKLQENSNSKISIPWKNLMISGWCLANDKTKMSKSKGNVVTPTALIEEKSADVVRYWASASNLGADIAYSEEVFKIGQKLITKLFNCAKFCSQHFDVFHQQNIELTDQKLLKLITHSSDLWILSRLEQVIKNYHLQFKIFEYAKAREIIEEFFWHYFCDNYLEICKVRSYGLSAQILENVELNADQKNLIIQKQLSAIASLYFCLKNILKLFAPFIPHICEEIYSVIYKNEFAEKSSIHARGNHVELNLNLEANNLENLDTIGNELLAIIFEVRKYKSEKNISMKTSISILKIATKLNLSMISDDILNVCNAQKIEFTNNEFLVDIIN